ncbi:TPA: alpha/beta hydrolase [Enterococcus faecalis]|nr:alpha/beta hydrolase [Enterococcus faecalis]HBM8960201.1 alpha/beta hydrolase [Enterococcus faecalis]
MNRWLKILIALIVVIAIGLIAAGLYFYNYAVVPGKKDFINENTPGSKVVQTPEGAWFKDDKNRQEWSITSEDGLRLKAIYLPADKKSNRTVIMAHGYMGSAETMSVFAKMYHDGGYNVLAPDARGHGKSQGDYIGFGWPDRKDYVQWIEKVLTDNGQQEQITLYGVSMGAATVMMTSGITKLRAGYFFGEASAVKQLQKNHLPMLFIHGENDTFVPFSMLDEVYNATQGPKEKYVVPGAEHAKAYNKNPEKYKETVAAFLDKYIK